MTFTASLSLFFAALLMSALAAAVAGQGGRTFYALEGVMLCGGLAGVLLSHEPAWVSLLAAGGAGMGAALLWGLPFLRHRQGQALAGIAFNGFAAAGAMIAAQVIGGVSYTRKGYWLEIYGENVTVFLPVALGALLTVWLLVHHSRLGLRLRLCGQSAAPERMGVRVRRTGILCLAFSGLLGGVGGLSALLSLGGGWRMAWGAGGMGYAALALAFAGKNGPFRVFGLVLLLTLLYGGAAWIGAPESALTALPILAALILLAMAGRKRPADERMEA